MNNCKLLIGFICICSVFLSCQKKPGKEGDGADWIKHEQKAEVIQKGEKENIFRKILFLNEFHKNFKSLEIEKRISAKSFKYDLSRAQIKSGEGRKRKNRLSLKGTEGVFSIKPNKKLMESEKLNLIEFDIKSRREVEMRLFMVPAGGNRDKLGDFILQRSLPPASQKKFQTVALDFSQRFGWEKKNVERFNIKFTSLKDKPFKIVVKNLRMTSHLSKLYEKIPTADYYRYGGAARRRLKSVFFPAGSRVVYTVSSPKKENIFIDGYLGSVDERPLNFTFYSGNSLILKKENVRKLIYFKKPLALRNGRTELTIEIKGESGAVGLIGNMSIFRPQKNRPNVVLYLVDALRADKLGINKKLFEKSFKKGAVFSNAYSNAVRTADSLPSLFSGRYKFTLVEQNEDVPFLSGNELLIAEYFKSKGYATAAFINNPWLDLSNSSQGFDQFYFCWNPVEGYSKFPSEKDYHKMKYGDMRSLLAAFAEHNREKPVFMLIHTMEPHRPYETPRKSRVYSSGASESVLDTLYEQFFKSTPYPDLPNPSQEELEAVKDLYRDAVLKADDYFHETLPFLRKNDVLNELSLLILTSDHGERFFEHQSWIHGPPDVYNEVVRIPLMISGNGVKSGVFKEKVQLLDIYPTLMEWMGDEPFGFFPGTSLLSPAENEDIQASERPVYMDGTGKKSQYAVIWEDIKVIIDGKKVEVYNLRTDPEETDNLASDPKFSGLIEKTLSFQEKFKRRVQKKGRQLSAEEKERLRTLGYIK